ncbi:helix-turn-helix domain-containing protein [Chitinophaga pinensis]|uniref:Transcriptional regulator, AraC family n=1 Tax=Chitinophaga pinensis (strain ATCC 43595 / DSM 2588 / LMG 13176 / NBRC 15968 / NCIMB 11800 / UQM 2034) TaxID=485918 RepID=A0A979G307_CHIPD|nr:helix-turn-helix domain-containing protein [Chitinophaga pinensis]ACU59997.1 transcriptional regulator, AraC family [Chitinophaga pinensis DSM 2588]
MVRENLYESVQVYYETSDSCFEGDKQLNFFELFYVLSGKGAHIVNGNKIQFKKNELFLLTPNDRHSFEVDEFCEFLVIRFGQNYVAEFQWKSIDQMECVLFHASHLSESILKNPEDNEAVASLMQYLLRILQRDNLYKEDLIRHLVNAIIVIAARNLSIIRPQRMQENVDEKILEMIDYIQAHIHKPDMLKLEVMADKFGVSKTYIGAYFRRQAGESLQQYISAYRIRLIEHRLRFSNKRITEIAEEFGFADESHVNKFFKRHTGVRLKSYRTKNRV